MYEWVDVVPVVSRSMVGMHLDILQVIHHMAAKIQNYTKSILLFHLAALEAATWWKLGEFKLAFTVSGFATWVRL